MCRWFAYISPTEPCLLEDALVTPKHSLSQQVHDHFLPRLLPHDHTPTEEQDMKARNILFNVDGLGVAWYTSSRNDFEPIDGPTGAAADAHNIGLRPAMYKTIQPPANDMNFRSICANTETRVLFAHIRAASGTAIASVNNHPFVFGRHTFMHNGVVSDFTAIRRAMCTHMSDAAFANIQGATDSEHLAALYMTFLTDSGPASDFERVYSADQMIGALHRAVALVLDLQRDILGDAKKKPNSLNLCATDGISLVAFRFRNHATSQPPSLYYSTKAGTTLNRKFEDHPNGAEFASDQQVRAAGDHGDHLIVASEPSTYKLKDWELIGKNQYVIVGKGTAFQVKDIPYSKAWDAVDQAS